MKKRTFFLIITLLFGGGTMFLTKNLTLYQTPEVLFRHPQGQPFEKEKDKNITRWQCYRNPLAEPVAKREFRLLSWNIHKGADNGWRRDLLNLVQDKQFVFLQEATTLQHIPQTLPRFKTMLHTLAFQFRHQQSGVLNLSDLSAERYCINAQPEPWLRLPKVMAAMQFAVENRSLLIVNVHLVNFEWKTTAYQYQLETLKQLVAQHHGAVVLTGDFNAWSKNRNAQLQALIRSLGLTAVHFSPDERIKAFGYPLDNIFIRGVTVHSAQSTALRSSDHNPVELHFSLE
ncbi:endonuclease/exonuclease/phosphatase family protein [Actinobacillus succinogenes]|nr:endonuclease/exonuclease/phosphatase family protein [Actinobacillus succinogenes]